MAVLGKQVYDPARLTRFAEYIKQTFDNNTPQDYEILIDGFKAVKRTSNPEMFEHYQDFIFPESKILELIFYAGQSNNNDKYVFAFKEEYLDSLNNIATLQGIELGAQVSGKYMKGKKKWELEQLQQENRALKIEIDELIGQVETLEAEKLKMEQGQSPLKGLLGEIGSSFVESFIRRNPKIIAKIPGGEALAGLLEEDKTRKPAELQPETEVSFKKTAPGNSLSEAEKAAIEFVEQLRERFSEAEFNGLLEILEKLASDKSKIGKVLNLLKARV